MCGFFLTYRVTNHRIEIERGCVSKQVDNLDLYRVVDIQLRVGIAGRLIGLGSIVLGTTDKTTPALVIVSASKTRQLYESLKQEAI